MDIEVRNYQISDNVRQCLRNRGQVALDSLPGLICRAIKHRVWEKMYIGQLKKRVEFNSFEEWVSHRPPEGIGGSLESIRAICQVAKDQMALDAIALITARGHGGDRHSPSFKADNINLERSPNGTSSAFAHNRLRKDRPDLHKLVLAGELTPHAAMIKAGFRKRKVQVDPTVKAIARMVRKQLDEHEIRQLIDKLQ